MTTLALDQQNSFWIRIYFQLSPSMRRVLCYFYALEGIRKKKRWALLFPKVSRIAFFASEHHRTVQKFFQYLKSDLPDLILSITPWFDESGRQSTNRYRMSKEFLKAMIWLDRRNLLDAHSDEAEKIIKEADLIERAPSPPTNGHPYSQASFSQAQKESGIHPKLKDLPLSYEEKISLSQNSESIIVRAKEDYDFCRMKGEVPRPFGLMITLISKYRRKGL